MRGREGLETAIALQKNKKESRAKTPIQIRPRSDLKDPLHWSAVDLSGLRDENSRAHRTHQGLLNTRRHVFAARQELPGDPGRRRVHVARPLHLTACGVAPPLRLAAPWAFARSRAAPGAVCGVANALCAHRLRAVTRSLAPPGLLSRQCPRLSLARRMCAALPRARALPPFCTFTRPGASRVTGCPTKTCRLHCEPCRIAAVLIWLQQLLP